MRENVKKKIREREKEPKKEREIVMTHLNDTTLFAFGSLKSDFPEDHPS